MTDTSSELQVERCLPDGFLAQALRADARAGLTATPKMLPPKWFYDERGSELFEKITQLAEYYPTRAERSILRRRAGRSPPPPAPHPGRTRRRRGGQDQAAARRAARGRHAAQLRPGGRQRDRADRGRAPGARPATRACRVTAVVSDFEEHLGLPGTAGPRLVAFLGGTIGNLLPGQRAAFLASLRARLRPGDALLLGTDLVKDPDVLLAAYDDAAGVTAAFNKNMLSVLNAELGANFDPDAFDHVALWDPRAGVDRDAAALGRAADGARCPAIGLTVQFAEGEEMRTEVSAKFRRDGVAAELAAAGFRLESWWTDTGGRFGLSLSVPGLTISPARRGARRGPCTAVQLAAALISSPTTRSASIAPQLNRSIAIRFSSGQVWMARCDSARMSTRVTAPFGKITWLESSTCAAARPRPRRSRARSARRCRSPARPG